MTGFGAIWKNYEENKCCSWKSISACRTQKGLNLSLRQGKAWNKQQFQLVQWRCTRDVHLSFWHDVMCILIRDQWLSASKIWFNVMKVGAHAFFTATGSYRQRERQVIILNSSTLVIKRYMCGIRFYKYRNVGSIQSPLQSNQITNVQEIKKITKLWWTYWSTWEQTYTGLNEKLGNTTARKPLEYVYFWQEKRRIILRHVLI